MGELTSATALVTGATSGLGRVTAKVLAAHGASVVVHGRNAQRGAHTVDDITKAGGTARFIAADLRAPTEMTRLVEECGSIDILVNNAGSMWFGPSAEINISDLDMLLDSNIKSVYLLTAALAPQMVARGSGSIINLSSLAAQVGMSTTAAYGATKASLQALTRAWAAEFSPSGVRINAIAPGPIQPEAGSDPVVDSIARTTLLGRAAHAEEVAEVIAFLAGPRASYITGATIPVDGGRTAV